MVTSAQHLRTPQLALAPGLALGSAHWMLCAWPAASEPRTCDLAPWAIGAVVVPRRGAGGPRDLVGAERGRLASRCRASSSRTPRDVIRPARASARLTKAEMRLLIGRRQGGTARARRQLCQQTDPEIQHDGNAACQRPGGEGVCVGSRGAVVGCSTAGGLGEARGLRAPRKPVSCGLSFVA